jgi:hypothetical protein
MKTVVTDPISWTTHQLNMCFSKTDSVLSSCTAFVYERAGLIYLITNWHNVAGRHPVTGTCLSETLAVPDIASTVFRDTENPAGGRREHIQLFRDSEMRDPQWYEHPVHGRNVDVVAIPLPVTVQKSYKVFAINAVDFDTEFAETVADDAFVIGYPLSDMPGHFSFPVWKRASIASEPGLDLDGLPKFLIDTATRPGLSGSPVVMQRVGLHGAQGGVLTGKEIIGRIRSFVGVYSGRIGKGETMAQLGIVWKARVIDEIIDGKVFGAVPGLE